MEFLVNIEIQWPPDADETERERLFAAELMRGRDDETAAAGAGPVGELGFVGRR